MGRHRAPDDDESNADARVKPLETRWFSLGTTAALSLATNDDNGNDTNRRRVTDR